MGELHQNGLNQGKTCHDEEVGRGVRQEIRGICLMVNVLCTAGMCSVVQSFKMYRALS